MRDFVRVAGGDKRNLTSVRRQRRLVVERRIIGQSFQPGAVCTNAIDVRLPEPVALRRKHDPPTVGRIRRMVVEPGSRQERMLLGAVGVGDVER